MKTKIERYLERKGFQRLYANIPGLSVYFTIENSYINAFVMADADGEPGVTKELLDSFLEKSDWKAPNGETIDVHALSVIFSADVEKARAVGESQTFCWYIDTIKEELVIDEGKCEDFYGMKSVLNDAIKTEEILPEDISDIKNEVTIEQPVARRIPYVNYGLLIANLVLYFLCIFNSEFFYGQGAFDLVLVINEHDWYRFITSVFLHADVYHLSGNMIYLYTLGDIVERELGHVKYFVLYMLSGLAGNIMSMAFSIVMNDFTPSLGASGAIFGITGALLWIVIRNRGRHEEITIPKIIFLIAYSLYNGFVSTNVDNAAHVGGLIGGFVLAILLYRKKGKAKERGRKP
ncbi:MAG: rhomboid family intramembrane serine protease [Lachnospiraceae bacterium]|nr:rhomboid family intramembrane serine protease [Lachnospiraceae bacterium]